MSTSINLKPASRRRQQRRRRRRQRRRLGGSRISNSLHLTSTDHSRRPSSILCTDSARSGSVQLTQPNLGQAHLRHRLLLHNIGARPESRQNVLSRGSQEEEEKNRAGLKWHQHRKDATDWKFLTTQKRGWTFFYFSTGPQHHHEAPLKKIKHSLDDHGSEIWILDNFLRLGLKFTNLLSLNLEKKNYAGQKNNRISCRFFFLRKWEKKTESLEQKQKSQTKAKSKVHLLLLLIEPEMKQSQFLSSKDKQDGITCFIEEKKACNHQTKTEFPQSQAGTSAKLRELASSAGKGFTQAWS